MAASAELTPTEYIGHHLTFNTHPFGDGPFWMLNVDTVVTSLILGIVALGFMWWVVRGATAGVPNKRQAFVELLIDFIDVQVKDIFHGDRRFIAPVRKSVPAGDSAFGCPDPFRAVCRWCSGFGGA